MKSLNIKVIVLGAVLLLAACVDESAVNALDNVQLGMSSGSQDASGTDLSGGTSSNGFGDVALASSSSANAFDGAAGSNDAGDSGISSGDSAQQPSQPTSSDSSILPSSSANGAVSVPDVDDESASNENAPVIVYTASGATVSNDNGCVSVSGGEVVISCAGDYDFSGSYSGQDAQIRVSAAKSDSGVYLNLRGLTLENTADAPIYVQMASKAFVVAKNGTVNTLSDAATRTKVYAYQNSKGENKEDTTSATIYSKDDLTVKGSGTLNVNGNYNNGIQSSNDLRFRGETLVNVVAKNNGVKGKGKVDIEKGTFTINTTEGDGIKSDEGDDENTIVEGKGVVLISGGTVTIKAGDDGIQAQNYVRIDETNGSVSIKITAGSGSPDKSASNGFGGPGGGFPGNGGGGGFPGGNNWRGTTLAETYADNASSDSDSTSKGIVGSDSVIIDAGTIEVASFKDAVHSKGYVNVNGGNLKLAGRNGIHADEIITITDGVIYVTDSFEAFEARQIIVKGGVTDAVASNDGWNAGTGNEGCTGNCLIQVTGGYHHMLVGSGDTDGIDSNGDIDLSGGVIVVECQMDGGMGGSFDSNGKTTMTGTSIIGFGKRNSEEGMNNTVNFSSDNYYGNTYIAFKPSFSGSYIQTPNINIGASVVNDVSAYAKNVTFPSGVTVYHN